MPADVRDLVRVTAAAPTRALDTEAVVRAARRRTRTVRSMGAVTLTAVAAAVLMLVPGGVGDRALVIDQPPTEGEGHRVVSAGDLALSVPATWTVRIAEDATWSVCSDTLYRIGDTPPDGPLVSVYPHVGHPEACRTDALPNIRPPVPGIVLFSYTGLQPWLEHGFGPGGVVAEETTLGDVEVRIWRGEPQPEGSDTQGLIVDLVVPIDGDGGMWVSDVDDPEVAAVLATLTRAR